MKNIVVLILIVALCSCVPTVVNRESGYNVAYVAGQLQARQDKPIDDVWLATQDALVDLGLTVSSKEKDSLTGAIVARGAEDKKVSVSLERLSDNRTMVRIRVGVLGDENLSFAVLDRIENRLGLGTEGFQKLS